MARRPWHYPAASRNENRWQADRQRGTSCSCAASPTRWFTMKHLYACRKRRHPMKTPILWFVTLVVMQTFDVGTFTGRQLRRDDTGGPNCTGTNCNGGFVARAAESQPHRPRTPACCCAVRPAAGEKTPRGMGQTSGTAGRMDQLHRNEGRAHSAGEFMIGEHKSAEDTARQFEKEGAQAASFSG